jgi:hypothetical protein
MRAGHINIEADQSCSISRLSAIGATIGGTIDCNISGDFRNATLGTAQEPLTGKAFQVADGTLQKGSLDKITNFIVDTYTATRGDTSIKALRLNGEDISLQEVKEKIIKKPLGELKSDTNYYIERSIHTREDFNQMFSRFSSLTFEDNGRTITNPAATFLAEIVDSAGGVPGESKLSVSVKITAYKGLSNEILEYTLSDLTGEQALYAVRRQSYAIDERDILRLHDDTMTSAPATPTGAPIEAEETEEDTWESVAFSPDDEIEVDTINPMDDEWDVWFGDDDLEESIPSDRSTPDSDDATA